ncbi:MAG: type II toxin-antitoxin system RelE/ParE family toxin [Patescibacteria group bacterium]
MHITFSESAKRDIEGLPSKIRLGLKNKLAYWEAVPQPLDNAKPLTQHTEATHRFRFGAYRIIVKKIGNELRILRVRHRKDVYR